MTRDREEKDSPRKRRDAFLNLLRRKHIDAAVVSDFRHVYYFTGYSTFWSRSTSLLILTQAESYLLLGESRAAEARRVYDGHIVTFEDYSLTKRMVAYAGFVAKELSKFLKSERVLKGSRQIGLDDWHMPYAYAEAVALSSPRIRVRGVTEMILSLRRTKGADEIQHITKATERLELAYAVARAHIAPGRTEMELCKDVMSDSILKHGPFEFSRGDTWVSGRERTVVRRGPPTDRIMREGDSIILDLQSVADNYWADGARTYVIGGPSREQERIFNSILNAKRNAEQLLRPGTACKDVYEAVRSTIQKDGYSGLFPHHAGHGIGLEDQEGPFLIPGSHEKLEEGVVCTIEPGIYDARVGGFRDEDIYIITKEGFEKITTPAHGLQVD